MATVKPINAVWKLVPSGKGMSMIQSDPLPTEDAQLRLDDLEKEEGPDEEMEGEGMEKMMGKMGGPMGMKPGAGRPMPMGRGAVPPFGSQPGGMPGGAPMKRGPVPPFEG